MLFQNLALTFSYNIIQKSQSQTLMGYLNWAKKERKENEGGENGYKKEFSFVWFTRQNGGGEKRCNGPHMKTFFLSLAKKTISKKENGLKRQF